MKMVDHNNTKSDESVMWLATSYGCLPLGALATGVLRRLACVVKAASPAEKGAAKFRRPRQYVTDKMAGVSCRTYAATRATKSTQASKAFAVLFTYL